MHAALVFGNTAGAQSDTVSLLKGFKAIGGKIVVNLKLARDQTSYNTEVEQLLAAHPDVIFTEADPATSATFFSDLKQLNHTKLLPIVGSETTLEGSWVQAVQRAVGGAQLKKYQVGVQPYSPTTGPAYQTFRKALVKVKGFNKTTIAVYTTDPYAMGYYDSVNIYALAILKAKSTKRSVFNNDIAAVSNPGPGKVVVHTFAAGAKALKEGKSIEYYGASGQIAFNKWHNSTGAFEVAAYVKAGQIKIVDVVSASAIARLSSRS
jgi:ABC-type branched-subunit amino acid transport system substrate-binding protein